MLVVNDKFAKLTGLSARSLALRERIIGLAYSMDNADVTEVMLLVADRIAEVESDLKWCSEQYLFAEGRVTDHQEEQGNE